MVWVRVDSTLAREPFVGAIAEQLGLPIPTVVGLWVSTTLGFAEYRKDGNADAVTDTSLEQWAGWPGKAGRYAAAYREHCVEREEGQRDAPGTCKLWWRQEALLKRALADLERLRKERQDAARLAEASRTRREAVAETSRDVYDGVVRNVVRSTLTKELTTTTKGGEPDSHLRGEVDRVRYGQLCVVACNRGLADNPLVRGYNELTTSEQDAYLAWIDEGVPQDLAVEVIYARAKQFRPVGRRRQPTTLTYFNNPVRDAWERRQARDAAPDGDLARAIAEGRETEGDRLIRELTEGT